ncbi:MAG: hypothetical protein QXP52_00145 [Candidatus Aenigmatarchaeota archaeon]
MICPLIGKCNENVKMEYYVAVCSNVTEDAYKKCQAYKKFAEMVKTPSEWSTFFRP